MKRSDVFKSKYLSQGDVSHPFTATIADVKIQTLGQGHDAEDKPVIYFVGEHKPMVMNLYNWAVCEEAYCMDSDLWRGRNVEVYVDPSVMFGAKRVGGLRLRIPTAGHTSNGDTWTFEESLKKCAEAGMTKDDLIAALKSRGNMSYNSVRDTATVKELIAARRGEGEDVPLGYDNAESEIPF